MAFVKPSWMSSLRLLYQRALAPSGALCPRSLAVISDHVNQHAGWVFEVFLPELVEASNGAAVDNTMVA